LSIAAAAISTPPEARKIPPSIPSDSPDAELRAIATPSTCSPPLVAGGKLGGLGGSLLCGTTTLGGASAGRSRRTGSVVDAVTEGVADGVLDGQLTAGTVGRFGTYEADGDGVCVGVGVTDGVVDTGGVTGGVVGGVLDCGSVGVGEGDSDGSWEGDEDTGTGSVGGVWSALALGAPIVSRAGTAISSSGNILAELAITAQPRSSGRVPGRGSLLQYARDQRA
jgi:hypothetical protein